MKKRAASFLAVASLATTWLACSSSGEDAGSPRQDEGPSSPDATTTSTTTTTAPLGPPDASLEPALLEPRDLSGVAYWWELPFGSPDEFGSAPSDRARVDGLSIQPEPCAQLVTGFLTSTQAGPLVRQITSADGQLIFEQRVDREPDAADRWDPLAESFHDACEDVTVTSPDGRQGPGSRRNLHLPDGNVSLYPLEFELTGGNGGDGAQRGFVLFVLSPGAVHVFSLYSTAPEDVASSDELYDLAVSAAVAAETKLSGTLG